MENKERDI